eukprot:TRINITY_DN7299_c0_g1_i1.p1 TRINITY_DN7299_c0_g1~~TRINITY_DN7299_c0_g1_i1.p1  ORF type:complete len:1310 (-),score=417.85 TRINITY_DN7299_c0_g1_i1:141-4070(-)
MTSVDRMLIRGIRSFSPDRPNIIEFYKPLTLLVGQNGCGKTTVIECLKYACTGELPPNCKNGQAFIHDTRVANLASVKAQIKLKFTGVSGKPYIVTRFMSLTQKAQKQECKTLESALQTYTKEGKKVSQSCKCSDLDKLIPNLMGVSTPILENVIFCHQEDSNWPLLEGTKLKQKFDEIFAASRYTKALEAVKKLKKDQMAAIRDMKVKIATLSSNKEQATKLKVDLKEYTEQVSKSAEQLKELGVQLDTLESHLQALKAKRNAVSRGAAELVKFKANRDQLTLMKKQLHQELRQEYTVSDEELLRMSEQFDNELRQMQEGAEKLTGRQREINDSKQRCQRKLQQCNIDQGKFQEILKTQAKLRADRAQQLADVLAKYNLAQVDPSQEMTDRQAVEYMRQVEAQLVQLQASLKAQKERAATQLAALDVELEDKRRLHHQLQDKIAQDRKLIEEKNRKKGMADQEIRLKETEQSRIGELESAIENEIETTNALKSELSSLKLEAKIADLVSQKVSTDATLVELSSAMKELNLQASLRTRVNMKQTDHRKKEHELAQRLSSRRGEMESLVSVPLPSLSALPSYVQRAWQSRHDTAARTRQALDEASRGGATGRGLLASARETLARLRDDLAAACSRLRDEIAGDDLMDVVRCTEEAIAAIRKELATKSSSETLYRDFIDLSQRSHQCPLCERPFAETEKLEEFVAKLEHVLVSIPGSRKAKEAGLVELEAKLARLNKLKLVWAEQNRLRKEIVQQEAKVTSLEESQTVLEDSMEKLRVASKEAAEAENAALSLVGDAKELSRMHADVAAAAEDLKSEVEQLARVSSDPRTLEEVSAQYEELQAQSASTNKKIDELRSLSASKLQEIQTHERKLSLLKDEASRMYSFKDSIKRLRADVEDLDAEVSKLSSELFELDDNVAEAQKDVQQHTASRTAVAAQLASQDDVAQHQRDALQQAVYKLQSIDRQIPKDGAGGPQAQLSEVARARAVAEKELLQLELESNAVAAKISNAQDGIAQQSLQKRNYSDNLRYRQLLAELRSLEAKIATKEEEMGGANLLEDLDTQILKLERECAACKTKRDTSAGSKTTLEENIKRINLELKRATLAKAEDEHKVAFIRLKTTELAHEDLERYYKALDNALMRYHSLKMEDINKIIRELWQATYRGNDIDTIEIRTEMNEGSKVKSYNYRVVMLKGETALDMRGRCSAGQKVLASLVIRMALAETFCVSCGIIALDEPTTNLDRYNVESFANALISILERRKDQSNFQLIIITHDEEFVQMLGRCQLTDHFWRVSKDLNGFSLLEKNDISALT